MSGNTFGEKSWFLKHNTNCSSYGTKKTKRETAVLTKNHSLLISVLIQ